MASVQLPEVWYFLENRIFVLEESQHVHIIEDVTDIDGKEEAVVSIVLRDPLDDCEFLLCENYAQFRITRSKGYLLYSTSVY